MNPPNNLDPEPLNELISSDDTTQADSLSSDPAKSPAQSVHPPYNSFNRELNFNAYHFNEGRSRLGVSTTWGFMLFQFTAQPGDDALHSRLIRVSDHQTFSHGLDLAIPYYETSIIIANGSRYTDDPRTESGLVWKNWLYFWDFKKQAVLNTIRLNRPFLSVHLTINFLVLVRRDSLKFLDKKSLSDDDQSLGDSLRLDPGGNMKYAGQIKLSRFAPLAKGREYCPKRTLIGYFNDSTRELIIVFVNQPSCPNLTLSPFTKDTVDFLDFSPDNRAVLTASKDFRLVRIFELETKSLLHQFKGYYSLRDKVNAKRLVFAKLLSAQFVVLLFDDLKTFRFVDLEHFEYKMMLPYVYMFDFHTEKIGGPSTEVLTSGKKGLGKCFPLVKSEHKYLGQEREKLLALNVSIYHVDGAVYRLDYDCLAHKCKVEFQKYWVRSPGKGYGERGDEQEDPESWTLV